MEKVLRAYFFSAVEPFPRDKLFIFFRVLDEKILSAAKKILAATSKFFSESYEKLCEFYKKL